MNNMVVLKRTDFAINCLEALKLSSRSSLARERLGC